LGRNRSRFAQDHARCSAIGVVLRHQRVGHTFNTRALTRERRHDDAVAKSKGTGFERVEKIWHFESIPK
jgi:hypothetical protein